MFTSAKVEARRSPVHGLGVFACTRIAEDEVVECCPVLVLDADDADVVSAGSLSGHVYDWGDGQAAIALGCGSLYNHDADPSAEYEIGDDAASLVVRARRAIAEGEEITIDYTGGGQIELWFEPRA
jgi:SET domain-containing protein